MVLRTIRPSTTVQFHSDLPQAYRTLLVRPLKKSILLKFLAYSLESSCPDSWHLLAKAQNLFAIDGSFRPCFLLPNSSQGQEKWNNSCLVYHRILLVVLKSSVETIVCPNRVMLPVKLLRVAFLVCFNPRISMISQRLLALAHRFCLLITLKYFAF